MKHILVCVAFFFKWNISFAFSLNYYKNISVLVLNFFFFLMKGICPDLVSLTKHALVGRDGARTGCKESPAPDSSLYPGS